MTQTLRGHEPKAVNPAKRLDLNREWSYPPSNGTR
jgi:hypothetical protein